MKLFTIYKNPADYPDKFVVREREVIGESIETKVKPIAVTDTLEQARSFIADGSFKFPRDESDDLCIVETYV